MILFRYTLVLYFICFYYVPYTHPVCHYCISFLYTLYSGFPSYWELRVWFDFFPFSADSSHPRWSRVYRAISKSIATPQSVRSAKPRAVRVIRRSRKRRTISCVPVRRFTTYSSQILSLMEISIYCILEWFDSIDFARLCLPFLPSCGQCQCVGRKIRFVSIYFAFS